MKKNWLITLIVVFLIFSIATPPVLGATKGSTMAEVQKKITSLTKQVKDLKNKLGLKIKETDKLKKEKSALQNQIKTKDLSNKNKDIQIVNLNKAIKEKDINLLDLTESINDKNIEISDLSESIVEKDETIEELHKKIKQLEQLSSVNFIYTDEKGNLLSSNSKNAIKWYEFRTDQITIYLTAKAFNEFGYIIDISDEVVTDICQYFNGNQLPQNMAVFISFNDTVSKATSGEYFAGEKRAFIRGESFYPHNRYTQESLVDVYVHELTHAFQDALAPNLFNANVSSGGLYWLTEGMASYVEHQFIPYENYAIPEGHLTSEHKYNKEEYRAKILRSIKENNIDMDSFTKLPERMKMYKSYEIYESLIYFIENKYNHNTLLTYTKSLETQDPINSFMPTFKTTEEQFINDWKEYYSLK
ncbi:hypothetical protein [Neobacillus sp. D3-1R]|uniref:hypothetical protein n=1 Tax=Neobacillus sp. D3-1R TaxID=3445778 RepID=UPI003F9EDF01